MNSLTSTVLGFGSRNLNVPRSPERIQAAELSQLLSKYSGQVKDLMSWFGEKRRLGCWRREKAKTKEDEGGIKERRTENKKKRSREEIRVE